MAIVMFFIWTMLVSFNILEILLEVKGYIVNNNKIVDDGKVHIER